MSNMVNSNWAWISSTPAQRFCSIFPPSPKSSRLDIYIPEWQATFGWVLLRMCQHRSGSDRLRVQRDTQSRQDCINDCTHSFGSSANPWLVKSRDYYLQQWEEKGQCSISNMYVIPNDHYIIANHHILSPIPERRQPPPFQFTLIPILSLMSKNNRSLEIPLSLIDSLDNLRFSFKLGFPISERGHQVPQSHTAIFHFSRTTYVYWGRPPLQETPRNPYISSWEGFFRSCGDNFYICGDSCDHIAPSLSVRDECNPRMSKSILYTFSTWICRLSMIWLWVADDESVGGCFGWSLR